MNGKLDNYSVFFTKDGYVIDKNGFFFCGTIRKEDYCVEYNSKRFHRLIYESWYGKIPDDCDIHHINHNPYDNRLENLQLVTKKEHQEIHQIKDKNVDWDEKINVFNELKDMCKAHNDIVKEEYAKQRKLKKNIWNKEYLKRKSKEKSELKAIIKAEKESERNRKREEYNESLIIYALNDDNSIALEFKRMKDCVDAGYSKSGILNSIYECGRHRKHKGYKWIHKKDYNKII